MEWHFCVVGGGRPNRLIGCGHAGFGWWPGAGSGEHRIPDCQAIRGGSRGAGIHQRDVCPAAGVFEAPIARRPVGHYIGCVVAAELIGTGLKSDAVRRGHPRGVIERRIGP